MHGTNWLARVLWLMLATSACWVMYLFAASYGGCRADGSGKLGCFMLALFMSVLEAIVFIVLTIVKLLLLMLP
jgi:hypothetical protein